MMMTMGDHSGRLILANGQFAVGMLLDVLGTRCFTFRKRNALLRVGREEFDEIVLIALLRFFVLVTLGRGFPLFSDCQMSALTHSPRCLSERRALLNEFVRSFSCSSSSSASSNRCPLLRNSKFCIKPWPTEFHNTKCRLNNGQRSSTTQNLH